MPRYDFFCSGCGAAIEVVRSMSDITAPQICECGTGMQRDYQAEGVLVTAGRRQYHKPIVSDSLAMHPSQIEEHKRMFPNIQVTPDGRPVFDNFSDHEAYMKKCNIVKHPQKTKRKKSKTPTPSKTAD